MQKLGRRGFLGALAGAALAGATLDPERLLWVPGAKLISIPRPSPIPARRLFMRAGLLGRALNPEPLLDGAQLAARYNLAIQPLARLGDTFAIREPVRFTVQDGLYFGKLNEPLHFWTRVQ